MNRRLFPGAWYGDALPDGSYVVQVPEQPLETNHGLVLLPPGEDWGLQFLAIGPNGKFAGLAHDLGRTYEWTGSEWRSAGYASGRAIYVNGELRDTLPAGYGFVDDNGQPVSRLVTYETRNGLNNWSETVGLLIGQGHESGLHVYDGTVLRVLDTGACNEPRTHRINDLVTETYRKDGEGVWIVTATLSELRELPPLVVPTPGTPLPNPGTPETPTMNVPESEKSRAQIALAMVRERLGFGPNQPPLPYVKAVAQLLGYPWGLNGKRGNANDPSGDILAYDLPGAQPQLFDVLEDGGGSNKPQFNALEYPQPAGAVFIRVESAPLPPPVIPPPATDLTDVLARLDVLDTAARANRIHIADVENALAALMYRTENLEHKSVPTYKPFKGRTSRVLGHAHDISIMLEPE